jgi:hypothetical protein
MNGAGAIIEILKAASMLKEEAGELVATFDEHQGDPAPDDGQHISGTGEAVISATLDGAPAGTRPTVSIHVQVRCTADEIDELAPRLKALLRELSTED